MKTLHFDFRDIFKSNRIAFSLQRIWIQFAGLTKGYMAYLVLTYISLMTSGKSFSESWQQMGLLPCLARVEANWYSWIIFLLGVLALIIAYLITATAVSRATYMQLKGSYFYTWKESFRFALRKSFSIIMSPVAIAILIGIFVLGGAIVGLLAKIPVAGEIGFSLLLPVWVLGGLLIVFFIIIFLVSITFTPAIIATTDDDAFEAVFQSFSTFWNQPWRMILYQTLSFFLSVAGVLVLAFLIKQAFLVIDSITASVVGDKYMNLMSQGMYLLGAWTSTFSDWLKSVCGENTSLFYFGRDFLQLKLPAVLNFSSYIFAVMMMLVGAWILSYGIANYNAATTLSYLVLRKKKENDNLLERLDREEEDDLEEDDEGEQNEEKE